jgi:hypothetical protein
MGGSVATKDALMGVEMEVCDADACEDSTMKPTEHFETGGKRVKGTGM